MRDLCATFLLAAFALFYAGTVAIADDDDVWHVSNAFGNVWVTVGGVQQASLAHTRILKPGDSIRTGQNGRALLVRGEEYILISPNSAIEIPREKKQELSTTIIQRAGSIVLEVEKHNFKHFEVETPLLAALVKGTRFRVTVEKNDTYVDVLRGQVEVSDFKSGQYALVQPGQTAKVSAQGSVGLSLSGSGALSPIQQGTPRRSSLSPAPITNERRSAADSPQNEQQIDEASLHGDIESIPASPGKSAAKKNMRLSSSAIPAQASAAQTSAAQASKEDRLAPESAPRGQQVRVASLLNEGASSVATLRQSGDNANDSSKPDDDSMRSILWVVGIAFIVSFAVSAQRRRKKQKQNPM
jgi:ferric-dicitrate binding protein FerR (iron transport regulator)